MPEKAKSRGSSADPVPGASREISERQDLRDIQALRERGATGDALVRVDALLQRLPGYRAAILAKADILLSQQKPVEALAILDVALAAAPDHPALGLRRVRALTLSGNPRRAIEAADALIATHGPTPERDVQKVLALRACGKTAEALELIDDVLARHPDNRAAVLAKSDVLITAHRHAEALDLIEVALARAPGDPVLSLRHARAHLRAGDPQTAMGKIDALIAAHGESPDRDVQKVHALRDCGEVAAALALAEDLHARHPEYRAAILARADTLLAAQRPADALALLDEALRRTPGDGVLGLRRARTMLLCGAPRDAVAQVDALIRDLGSTVDREIQKIHALREANQGTEALRLADNLLARHPGDRAALLAKADVLLSIQKPAEAQALLKGAVARAPDDPQLGLRCARATLLAGDPRRAIELIDALIDVHGPTPERQLQKIHALSAAGRTPEARDLVEDLLRRHPGHHPAVIAKADMLLAAQQPADARALLEDALAASPADSGEILLRLAEAHRLAGDLDAARRLLTSLTETSPDAPSAQPLKLLTLASQLDDSASEAQLVAALLERERLSSSQAIALMNQIRPRVSRQVAQRVAQAVLKKLDASNSSEALVEITAITDGDAAAIDCARRQCRGRQRTVREARQLARLLASDGRAEMAARYLRLCVRKWPADMTLLSYLLRCLSQLGRCDAALRHLNLHIRENPGRPKSDRLKLRVGSLVAAGRLKEAHAEIASAKLDGCDHSMLDEAMRLFLAMGDSGNAENCFHAMAQSPQITPKRLAHFKTSLLGARLNELRIMQCWQDPASPSGQPDIDLLGRFSGAAVGYLVKWAPVLGPNPDVHVSPIPRRIFQYWNDPKAPDEVEALMQGWRNAVAFEYERFNHRSAAEFIAAHMGSKFALAFKMANNAAEECDFFRLCYLFKMGGIYADADDRLLGNPAAALTGGAGAVLIQESCGSIANNFIACIPEHPVIGWALDTAADALLTRDNSNTWLKTGPGLLSRATAVYLENCRRGHEFVDAAICNPTAMNHAIQFHVPLAYKKTPGYWDKRQKQFQDVVMRKIAAATAPDLPTGPDQTKTAAGETAHPS